mgnify:FL=1
MKPREIIIALLLFEFGLCIGAMSYWVATFDMARGLTTIFLAAISLALEDLK